MAVVSPGSQAAAALRRGVRGGMPRHSTGMAVPSIALAGAFRRATMRRPVTRRSATVTLIAPAGPCSVNGMPGWIGLRATSMRTSADCAADELPTPSSIRPMSTAGVLSTNRAMNQRCVRGAKTARSASAADSPSSGACASAGNSASITVVLSMGGAGTVSGRSPAAESTAGSESTVAVACGRPGDAPSGARHAANESMSAAAVTSRCGVCIQSRYCSSGAIKP